MGSDGPQLFVFFDDRGLEGLIDASGNVVVQPAFDEILLPTEGLCATRIGELWGYVDQRGEVAISPRWVAAEPFSGGLALVVERRQKRVVGESNYERSLCGFVNPSGKYMIPPVWYTRCRSFHEGLAAAEVDRTDEKTAARDGWAGYVDEGGRWAIPPVYHGTEDFSNGFGLVRRIGNRGKEILSLVDAQGTVLKLPRGWAPIGGFSEGLAPVGQASRGCVGAVNRDGALVFSMTAQALAPFSEGRAAFRRRGRFGYVDASGNIVIRPTLFCAEAFSDGLARVCSRSAEDERYVNANGKVVLIGGEGRPRGRFHGSLQFRLLKGRTIRERPNFRNIYGYRNKTGKYVWLSPGSGVAFDAAFWRKKYVGPQELCVRAV